MSDLAKALPGIPQTHADQEPRPLDYKALRAAVERARKRQAERIRKILEQRIKQILKG